MHIEFRFQINVKKIKTKNKTLLNVTKCNKTKFENKSLMQIRLICLAEKLTKIVIIKEKNQNKFIS